MVKTKQLEKQQSRNWEAYTERNVEPSFSNWPFSVNLPSGGYLGDRRTYEVLVFNWEDHSSPIKTVAFLDYWRNDDIAWRVDKNCQRIDTSSIMAWREI